MYPSAFIPKMGSWVKLGPSSLLRVSLGISLEQFSSSFRLLVLTNISIISTNNHQFSTPAITSIVLLNNTKKITFELKSA